MTGLGVQITNTLIVTKPHKGGLGHRFVRRAQKKDAKNTMLSFILAAVLAALTAANTARGQTTAKDVAGIWECHFPRTMDGLQAQVPPYSYFNETFEFDERGTVRHSWITPYADFSIGRIYEAQSTAVTSWKLVNSGTVIELGPLRHTLIGGYHSPTSGSSWKSGLPFWSSKNTHKYWINFSYEYT